jgi:DNA-binding NarL/FixJ family response regulator
VARGIRAAAPDVGLIMLTGVADDAVLRAALLAGCTGFITKDRGPEDVVEAVRAVHDGRGAIDPAATARLATMQVERTNGATGGLTEREREVLVLLAEGATTRDIAERLFISVNTARNHVQRLITKLGAHSRLEAVATARRGGLLEAVGG